MDYSFLSNCPICKNIPVEKREEFIAEFDYKINKYKKGDYIAYQGDLINYMYLLIKGKVKTEIVADTGLTLHIEEIIAPYPLAAAFLFADNNRFPVDVIALEPTEVILLKKESVEKQLAANPLFLKSFMAFNANRTQFLSERLKIFSQKGIKSKFAYYILQRAKDGKFELEKTQTALAEYFGVTRPSLSRCISEMENEGVICLDKGSGKILNSKKLNDLIQ